jgi:hypothetical protein
LIGIIILLLIWIVDHIILKPAKKYSITFAKGGTPCKGVVTGILIPLDRHALTGRATQIDEVISVHALNGQMSLHRQRADGDVYS